ncbi:MULTISPECIES: arginine repressor [Desulfosporosinus]|uniref:Arginine repressor n=2 Tax=Desulfosporosinus TaxID=79206 RepID=A0A1M5YYP7_9FIRM|nr:MULTISPECIES: arginine repressor [Desulfosporosinus]MDA8222091.1 arginine repressor [Desulfitobacterium hafniense]MCO1600033.1 arginine repressor [Desulfosporosinus nitroreducens]MCO5387974.1 arginine repressor [Desulfosporosinus sp.]MDO0822937.1 arginine repressor [Desulfosporosinus nitroreducens]SHI17182.1 transcriptional regulator, ArgR family [Desulfosporosinus lacus DSM 15449]
MKARRQMKVQEIITKQIIHTQEDLADKLRLAGFDVTQATVSRDIKEMGLIKVPSQGDEYRYAVPSEHHPANLQDRLKRLLREAMVSINDTDSLIVIRTIPGNAHALAAVMDNSNWEELIGTVAGDDTILLVIKPKEAVQTVLGRISALLG